MKGKGKGFGNNSIEAEGRFHCGGMMHSEAQCATPSTAISPVYTGDTNNYDEGWNDQPWGGSFA